MRLRFTRHAITESMPGDKICVTEVEDAIRKSELTVKVSRKKFKFRYKDVEVVCQREKDYWLVITCYRIMPG